MNISWIPNDTLDISSILLMENNKIKLLPSDHYKKFTWNEFRLFCHNYSRYGIPTIELIDFLKNEVGNRETIEVGSGCGDLGFHLKTRMTDNKQQKWSWIKKMYEEAQQPVIKYPDDVEEIDALDAVKKYKPQVVIGSWITTYSSNEMPYRSNPNGIKENEILKLVDTLIIIGNSDVHGDKPILKLKHEIIKEPWIVSRAKNPENNCIYIWNTK